jgi:hypothetical protein
MFSIFMIIKIMTAIIQLLALFYVVTLVLTVQNLKFNKIMFEKFGAERIKHAVYL